MVPAIGNQFFITLKGQVDNFASALDQFSRPGIDGVGFQDLGKRGQETTLNSTADVSSVDNTFAAYKRLVGTLQTVTNDFNVTYTRVMILGVSRLSGRAVSIGRGGLLANPAAVLACTWRVQRT